MVDWMVVGTSAITACLATGIMGPLMNAHLGWKNAVRIADHAEAVRQAGSVEALRRDIVELHRHFNENDTVLTQAFAHMDATGDILSTMNIAKLGVPIMPLTLSTDQIMALPGDLRQRVLFFRRLLPNIDHEIAEAAGMARARDYGELLRLIALLIRKNEFMLKSATEMFLILSGAIAASARADADQLERGGSDIMSYYPRPVDKTAPKDLHYYDRKLAGPDDCPGAAD